jgi:hypothetical protein
MILRLTQTVWAWAENNDHRDSRRDDFNAESSNAKLSHGEGGKDQL